MREPGDDSTPTPLPRKRHREEEEKPKLPQPLPGADFLELQTPQPEWLVSNLLLRFSLTAFAGPPGSGKTALALDSVGSVAREGRFKVLVITEENSVFDLKYRLLEGGCEPLDFESIDWFYGQNVNFSDTKAGWEWRAHFESVLPAYELVVFDTVADVFPGDLLDANVVNESLIWLRSVIRRYQKTGLLIIHSPKAVQQKDEDPRLADIFGSQVFGAKLDAAFLIRDFKVRKQSKRQLAEDEEDEKAEYTPLKECWNVKLRGFPRLEPRTARIEAVTVVNGAGPMGTVGVWRWEVGSPAQKRGEAAVERAAPIVLAGLKAFGPQPSASALYKAMVPPPDSPKGTRPGKQVFMAALNLLIQRSAVIRGPGEAICILSDTYVAPLPTQPKSPVPPPKPPRNRVLELAPVPSVLSGSVAVLEPAPESSPGTGSGGSLPYVVGEPPEPRTGSGEVSGSGSQQFGSEEKPNLSPLAQCVKVAAGVRCAEPIHPPGVWCLPHKQAVLGVAPPPPAAVTPPEASPSPRLAPAELERPVPSPLVALEPVSALSARPRPVSSWEDIP